MFLEQQKENCPYTLATELGVNISSYPTEAGEFVGWYMKSGRSTYRIYVNPLVDQLNQEKAIFILLKHHQQSPGEEKYILKGDLKIVNRIVNGIRDLDHIAANIFLKGSIFNKGSLFFK